MRVVVTGGAGFIGSHIVESYLTDGAEVVVLDDLSTGYPENVPPEVQLVEGDVADFELVRKAMDGADLVFHEAASRAVLRSVEDPLGTDTANTHGTLNVLVAARDAGARRVVLASSSSIYGGAEQVPTPETAPALPRSPYAVSKLAAEHYARVFWELYGLETVCLRYFNVFGPRQRPDSQYAAVIPLFIDALLEGRRPTVHGDGRQSRDFTFIADVVAANKSAVTARREAVAGQVFNIAQGGQTDLLELLDALGRITGTDPDPVFIEPRAGDVRRSCADAAKALSSFGFRAEISLEDGLRKTVEWVQARRGA